MLRFRLFLPRFLLGLLFFTCSLASFANSDAICQEESEFLQQLEQTNAALAAKVSSLRTLRRGESVELTELEQLLGGKLGTERLPARRLVLADQLNKTTHFEAPLCEKTSAALIRLQQINARLNQENRQLMQRFLSLPDDSIEALLQLAKVQAKINAQVQQFAVDMAGNEAIIEQVKQFQQVLSTQIERLFTAFLFIEPPSIYSLTRHTELMELSFDLDIDEQAVPESQLTYVITMQNELLRTRIALTHWRVSLHHLVWSQLSVWSMLLPSHLAELPDLLEREVRLFFWHLQQTLLETQLDTAASDNVILGSAWLLLLVSVFSGLLFIVALVYVAKQSENLTYWLHDWTIEQVKQQRWAVRLANGISHVAVLLPWLLLLLSLSWLADLLLYYQRYAWLWFLPVLQIIVIYNLLAQVLEWLIFKIANSAGSFLNAEQAALLQHKVKQTGISIMLPWALALIFNKVIGASLLFYLAATATFVVAYFRLAWLLKDRRNDFIKNTEQALAKEISPELEARLKGTLFYYWAPVVLPIQLGFFALLALNTVLQDFDWYKRLSARWFWLRTRYQLEQQEDNEDYVINEEYSRWFECDEIDGKSMPIIDTGLSRAIGKTIDSWMDDRVNENTLVLTGEKGMGKSMVLRMLEKELLETHDDLRILRKSIGRKTTSAAQIRSLLSDLLELDIQHSIEPLAQADEKLTPTVIILDECQNLFLSQIGGLEAWKTLLDITNTRLENVFWLFVINDQSWAYLGNVFGRRYQMRNVIRARRWSQNDIRSLVLSRTHLSGYRVNYDEVLLNSFSTQQNTGRSAEQRFFSLLWDSCKGVPRIALAMWLTAIETRKKEVWVGLPSLPDSSVLSSLGDDLLFVYRAILIHENVSVSELISVTKQSESMIRYALKTGVDMGFLYSESRRYRISALWQHSLTTYLARKNMSHE